VAGQVFAAPVLPFAGSCLTDEPGARHLTCQLFVQVQEAETTTPRKAGRCRFGRGARGPAPLFLGWIVAAEILLVDIDQEIFDSSAEAVELRI
jgi:hypothetical protein